MTRYIDADALKETVNAHDYVLKDCFNNIDKGMFTLGIMYAIEKQPTIDAVPIEWILNNERMPKEGKGHDAIMNMIADWKEKEEPVRHGKWIFNPSDAIEAMFTNPKCSECGFESADGGNYCSHCGARMG